MKLSVLTVEVRLTVFTWSAETHTSHQQALWAKHLNRNQRFLLGALRVPQLYTCYSNDVIPARSLLTLRRMIALLIWRHLQDPPLYKIKATYRPFPSGRPKQLSIPLTMAVSDQKTPTSSSPGNKQRWPTVIDKDKVKAQTGHQSRKRRRLRQLTYITGHLLHLQPCSSWKKNAIRINLS